MIGRKGILTIYLTPDQIAAHMHDEMTPTQEELDKAAHNNPADDLPGPYENEYNGQSSPPQDNVVSYSVQTISTDIGGSMQFPKDLISALKNLFTKAEDFLTPFISSFASQAGKDLLAIGIAAVAQAAANPTLLTNADKRNAALKNMEAQALAAGINAGETALANALQAAYTHINPANAAITSTVVPVAPSVEVPVEKITVVD